MYCIKHKQLIKKCIHYHIAGNKNSGHNGVIKNKM